MPSFSLQTQWSRYRLFTLLTRLLPIGFHGERTGLHRLKTRISNQPIAYRFCFRRAGMTLIEVVVALAITGLIVAGIVSGYIFCLNASEKGALTMAANSRALERIEQTRSAQWDTSVSPAVDQLVAANFPDTTVVLDQSGTTTNVTAATVRTEITQLSSAPPLRRIRVDCIWQFRGVERITNSIETYRAPDQ